jgi:hypothetical protein
MNDFSNKSIMLFNDLPWSKWPEVLPRTPDDEALPLKVGIYDHLVALLPDVPPGDGEVRPQLPISGCCSQ